MRSPAMRPPVRTISKIIQGSVQAENGSRRAWSRVEVWAGPWHKYLAERGTLVKKKKNCALQYVKCKM